MFKSWVKEEEVLAENVEGHMMRYCLFGFGEHLWDVDTSHVVISWTQAAGRTTGCGNLVARPLWLVCLHRPCCLCFRYSVVSELTSLQATPGPSSSVARLLFGSHDHKHLWMHRLCGLSRQFGCVLLYRGDSSHVSEPGPGGLLAFPDRDTGASFLHW